MNIALIKSAQQFKFFTTQDDSFTDKIVEIQELPTYNSEIVFVDGQDEQLGTINSIMATEAKYIPVIDVNSMNLSINQIEEMNAENLETVSAKASNAWTLSNNLNFIRDSFKTITHLRNIWVQDRDGFFEELWQTLKTNLNTKELQIIFNDLKEPSEKQKEKGAKAELFYATVKGKKKGQIFEAQEAEKMLMENYKNEFGPELRITEFNQDSGELVMAVKVNLSPVLVLAKVNQLSSVQKSILENIFNNLGEN